MSPRGVNAECPDCGSAMEATLLVWIEELILDEPGGTVIDGQPTFNADNPDNGLVVTEDPRVTVSCPACGYEPGWDISKDITQRWAFG